MFVISNLLKALASVVDLVLRIYVWIIIIRAIISWVNPDPYNPIVQFLYHITEPVLRPIRRIIPPIGGIDISPVVVLIIIYFLQLWLVPSLYQLAYSVR